MTRGSATLAGVVLVLGVASACATPREESRAEPASEREHDDLAAEKPVEASAAADEREEPPSLDELERELAANNAKLRELGALPVEPVELEDQEEAPEGGDASGSKGASTKTSSGSGTAGSSAAPAPGGQPKRTKADRNADKKRSRPSKSANHAAGKAESKAKDTVDGTLHEPPSPEPAKATPLAPNDAARDQDAALRCQQICDLAAISCDLGAQICELAERHSEEEDYASACERANLDCDAAKEACDVCVE